MIVSSLITHNAYGSHIGKSRKILIGHPLGPIASEKCMVGVSFVNIYACCLCSFKSILICSFLNFLSVDEVGILNDGNFLRGDIADDTYAESGTGERLSEYKMIGNTELKSYSSYLILEEISERLNDLLEINIIGKSAYVMMGLDNSGFSAES